MRKIQSSNPTTGQLLQEFDYISQSDLEVKIRKSQSSFDEYQKSTNEQKKSLLQNLAKTLENSTTRLATIITTETGKPLAQSVGELKKSIDMCNYFAQNLDEFTQPEPVINPHQEAQGTYTVYQPTGPLYSIIPFNFPLWLTFKFAIPQLAIGNTIIVRPSDSTPLTGLALVDIFIQSGFKNNEFQVVLTSYEHLDYIAQHKFIKGVTFTGSTKAGSIIAGVCGQYLQKHSLELGGSDPLIVLDNADVDKAVETAVQSRLGTSGQVCIAAKRFVIDESRFNEFSDKLISRLSNFQVGNPFDPQIEMGPMSRLDLLQGIEQQVAQSVQEGGKIMFGGQRLVVDGFQNGIFYEPTVVVVERSNILVREEVFGPVFALIQCKNDSEIIEIANDTDYGLGAAIFGKENDRNLKIARQIESGMVYINGMVRSDPRYPFGGTKMSGYGKECGILGFREFSNAQFIHQQ